MKAIVLAVGMPIQMFHDLVFYFGEKAPNMILLPVDESERECILKQTRIGLIIYYLRDPANCSLVKEIREKEIREKGYRALILVYTPAVLTDADIAKLLQVVGIDGVVSGPREDSRVLLATIGSLLRRSNLFWQASTRDDSPLTRVGGKMVYLTKTQSLLLQELLAKKGRFIPSEVLWKETAVPNGKTLKVHIYHLKKALDGAAIDDLEIVSRKGRGYKIIQHKQRRRA